ncbi:MAG TPA: putative Ig domain-containing protein, partial [Desulfomicrobiaceae bacterium]|nr:putative Ig domain-containing protein [Desulfomicrobiaceae bacterium]
TVVSTTADGEQVTRSVTINIDGLDEPIVTEPDSDTTPTPDPEPETPSGGDDTGDGDGQGDDGGYVNDLDDLDDNSGLDSGDSGETDTGSPSDGEASGDGTESDAGDSDGGMDGPGTDSGTGDADSGSTGDGTSRDRDTESRGGGSDTDSSGSDNSFDLVLDGGIEDKVFEVSETFKFQIPDNAFAIRVSADAPLEEQPEITLKATLANGNPLPQWMKFDPETATFTGTPPDGTDFIEVKVTAMTEDGQEADAVFTILLSKGEMPAGTDAQPAAPIQENEQNEESPETTAWESETRESLAALELMGLGVCAGVSVTGISTLTAPSRGTGVSRELRSSANDFTEKCNQFLKDLGLDNLVPVHSVPETLDKE